MLAVTLALLVAAALPSIWPERFTSLNGVQVDTDPENMLSPEEAVRVFHNDMKRVFALNDIVVLGVVNEADPNGVFNPQSLRNIYELTEYALTLRGEVIGEEDPEAGVISADVIAPSTVDNIEQGGPGVVKFEWLMPAPPETGAEALAIRDKARRIPFLDGTLVSEGGQALAIYLPLTSKNLSYKIYSRLQDKIAQLEGNEQYYITGLPVANDVFGVEMFIQMAISAPLAMLVIFLLLLFFFRKLALVVSPMIVAMVSVICTMGALIVTGNTIHIMSSMIPIFIMPIAVLDSIHILSEFFDRYQQTRDRRQTITAVMKTLFVPMLYTSLTSAAGFASLALTPIPPVQVFGLFVALGIMLAWLLTIVFIPAYIMLLPEKRLANFGAVHRDGEEQHGLTGRFLESVGRGTYRHAAVILMVAVAATVVAGVGIAKIQINDNPTKWFKKTHEIRVADRVLNEYFGGTYMAYLTLRLPGAADGAEAQPAPAPEAEDSEPTLPTGLDAAPALPAGLGGTPENALPEPTAESVPGNEVFKNPEVLRYMAKLQDHLLTTGAVGKSNSLADIVKTVHRELIDGSDAEFRIPDSRAAVAQCLMQYQSSHRPQDLWHLVTPTYDTTSIWVQLKSGDNRDMSRVVASIDAYIEANPPIFTLEGASEPVELEHGWFGLTYVNVVWQEKMVSGMLQAFLGSFLVVLLMMIVLFRSGLWGFLSMIPLTITIGLIYGVIGFIGKDYDMPVAVLSSLTLGLAVDFAIHFLARARALYEEYGSWEKAHVHVFGEPARAITRNVIVIAVGFLPLLFAPLVPYITVGVFLASILLVSGAATLLILPALIRILEPLLFPKTKVSSLTCRCGTCIAIAVSGLLLVLINMHQFLAIGWTTLTWVGLVALPALVIVCVLLSRREKCRTRDQAQ
ncbi:MAG: MMPL family transporter [Nitrospiraceae bacterium]|nr:MMPL family transporter [Nitrospiraceae bacterium]